MNLEGAWRILLGMSLAAILSCTLNAQMGPNDTYGQTARNDNPKINTNLGFSLPVPLNPTARFAKLGWGISAGVGANLNRRHGLVGEFMWNRMYATDGAIATIRTALQDQQVGATIDLYALTGNYRFELRGSKLGAYFIGGGGWYSRHTQISKEVPADTVITCSQVWIWWGVSCTSGTVTETQALAGSSSSALGGNGGVGLTLRVAEAPYRVYFESRYHYAPTKNISTQLISVSVGIRY